MPQGGPFCIKEYMSSISNVKPQRRNANRHTIRGMKTLEESIQKDGWIGAITVASDNETFDGSARLEVGVTQGFEDAIVVESDGSRPVIVKRTDIPSADDPRAKRLGIAANRVAQLNLDWSPDELAALQDEGDVLQGLFTDLELSDILSGLDKPEGAGGDDFDTTPQEGPTRVQYGELWQLGEHRVLCGDSSDVDAHDRLFDGDRPNMIWADPPYGMHLETKSFDQRNRSTPKFRNPKNKNWGEIAGDFEDFDPCPWLDDFKEVKEQFWWGADYYAERIPAKNEGSWLVWDKRGESTDSMIGSSFELCWTKVKHRREIIRILWVGILGTESEDVRQRVHPAQKPYRLAEWVFKKYGKAGDLIFDPFCGSGMSVIAAEKTDRKVYACEMSAEYCDVILRRWEAETGREAVMIDG